MELNSVIKKIEESTDVLKIITKTKNETLFIEKWIQHHLAIIGEGKLIIFDNMSDNKHVLSVYEKYKDNIILIRFKGYPDIIQDYTLLKPLYQAIGRSAKFFTILDSDEYLYLYDNEKAIHDRSILDYLKENNDCDFFTPPWLINKEKQDKVLKLPSELFSSIKWGKPIIHTKIFNNPKLDECHNEYGKLMFRHTFELPSLQYTKSKIAFFIAHLCCFSLDQRITTNMNKLASFGLLRDATDFEGLFSQTERTYNNDMQALVKATRSLVTMKNVHGDYPPSENQDENTLTIAEDNNVIFSTAFYQKTFNSLMNRDYLDLIDYHGAVIDPAVYPTFDSWMKR